MYSGLDDGHAPCSCGAPFVWNNVVDVTNGTWGHDGERIDGFVKLEVKEEAVYEECKCCGNRKLIKEQTYKVPHNQGRFLKTR